MILKAGGGGSAASRLTPSCRTSRPAMPAFATTQSRPPCGLFLTASLKRLTCDCQSVTSILTVLVDVTTQGVSLVHIDVSDNDGCAGSHPLSHEACAEATRSSGYQYDLGLDPGCVVGDGYVDGQRLDNVWFLWLVVVHGCVLCCAKLTRTRGMEVGAGGCLLYRGGRVRPCWCFSSQGALKTSSLGSLVLGRASIGCLRCPEGVT